jgi:hypothetical protein
MAPSRLVGPFNSSWHSEYEGMSKTKSVERSERPLAKTVLAKLIQIGEPTRSPEVAPDLHAGDGIICDWTNRPVAPWQTQVWLDQMRQSLPPNQYLRMIENKWVTTESSFVDMDWWDACVDPELRPALSGLPVWIGVDASTKRDRDRCLCVGWGIEARPARFTQDLPTIKRESTRL